MVGQIEKHFSGHLQDALVHAAKAGLDGRGIVRDAELLESAMAGAGTKVGIFASEKYSQADACDIRMSNLCIVLSERIGIGRDSQPSSKLTRPSIAPVGRRTSHSRIRD